MSIVTKKTYSNRATVPGASVDLQVLGVDPGGAVIGLNSAGYPDGVFQISNDHAANELDVTLFVRQADGTTVEVDVHLFAGDNFKEEWSKIVKVTLTGTDVTYRIYAVGF